MVLILKVLKNFIWFKNIFYSMKNRKRDNNTKLNDILKIVENCLM